MSFIIPPDMQVPAGFKPFRKTKMGTYWFIRPNGPGMTPDYLQVQDTQPILDQNAAMSNENDGWSTGGRGKIDKLLRRTATVPWGVIQKWKEELGVDYFSQDPDMQRKVDQLLDSSDWQKLRTAHFTIGKQGQWV